MLKILGIVALGLIIYLLIDALSFNGTRSFYCLSDDKCVTVWKRTNGEVYVICGKYKSRKIPSDNYIKTTNMGYGYVDIILTNNDILLVDIEDHAEIVQQSSDGLIELYNYNKTVNDSLYTCFDGKYRKYKEGIVYISIDIKENYAMDKNGKKVK